MRPVLIALLLCGCSSPMAPSTVRAPAQTLIAPIAVPEPGSGAQKMHLVYAEARHDCATLTIRGLIAAEATNPFPDPTSWELRATITYRYGARSYDLWPARAHVGPVQVRSMQTNAITGTATLALKERWFTLTIPFTALMDVPSDQPFASGSGDAGVLLEAYRVVNGQYETSPRYFVGVDLGLCLDPDSEPVVRIALKR